VKCVVKPEFMQAVSAQNFLLDGGLRKPLEREQHGWQGADRTYMYLYRLSGILASWNDTTTAQIEPHIKYRNYKEKAHIVVAQTLRRCGYRSSGRKEAV
jgi:hypothetical protein